MPLVAHLRELRRRLWIVLIGVVPAAVVGWMLSPWVLDLLRRPLLRVAAGTDRLVVLNYATIGGAFDVRLRVAICVALVLASPLWLWELWGFLSPGLRRSERRASLGFLAAAVPLFLAGCATGAWVLPLVVRVLSGLAGSGDAQVLDATAYLVFALHLMLGVGAAYVLPVLLVCLNLLGVLSARTIRGRWRIAVLVITVCAAILTPAADVVSMLVLMAPLLVLYGAACAVTAIHDAVAARRLRQLNSASAR